MPRDNERVNHERQKRVNTKQNRTTKGDRPTINTGPVVGGERQPDTVTANNGFVTSIAAPGGGELPRETGFNEELGWNPDGNQNPARRGAEDVLDEQGNPVAPDEA